MCIAPIEEVVLDHNDTMTLSSKRMQREEYWYRELCTVFLYGLNDNVKGVGNVSSKIGEGLVVYSLFNRHKRKYRKRSQKRHRKKVIEEEVNTKLQGILSTYKSVCFNFREYVTSLPKRKLSGFVQLVENIILQQNLPSRVLVLAKDLAAYRNRVHCMKLKDESTKEDKIKERFHECVIP